MLVVRRPALARGARDRGLACVVIAVLGLTTRVAHGQTEPTDAEASSPPPPAAPAPESQTEPTDAEASSPPPPAAPARESRFAFSLDGGFAYQTLYGVEIRGGDIDVVLGASTPKFTIAADIDFMHGATAFGLATNALTVGPLVEGHFDRVRVGGGVRFGFLTVDRATFSGSLSASSEGFFLRVSVDLYRFDEQKGSAVFLFAKGSADSVGGALVGGTLGVGMRL